MSERADNTELLHAAFETDHHASFGEPLTPPVVLTTSFYFPSLESGAAVARGDHPGFLYTRGGNPTVRTVERAVSALEGAEASLVVASGMAATTSTLLSLLQPGDHVVAGASQYGGTYGFLHGIAARMGITFSAVDATDVRQVEEAFTPKTRLVFVETIGNPMMTVPPIDAIAKVARAHDALLVVDNTFASGALFRPLHSGAAVVVNSATKYMNGHGDTVIGTISGSADLITRVRDTVNQLGGIANPLAAYLLWRGMATLYARMAVHSDSALRVAEALEGMTGVARVRYPGLKSHPQHDWAVSRFTDGRCGGMISIELSPDTSVDGFVDNLSLFHRAVSLGDATSLIEQPTTLTHRKLTEAEQASMELTPRTLRLSIGLESPADLIADLEAALAKAR
ncbi:MAG: trans-sulfuration enzyme family protein [Clostridia bacterium]